MAETVSIKHIATSDLTNLGTWQIGVQTVNDSDLGYKPWGAKDGTTVSIFLNKNQHAQIKSLTITDFIGTPGALTVDTNGDVAVDSGGTYLPISGGTMTGNIAFSGVGLTSATGLPVTIGTAAGNDFTINSTGFVYDGPTENVGIGKSAGSGIKLDVNGTIAGKSSLNLGDATNSGAVKFLHNSTNVITAIGASSNIEIRTNNTRAINIDSSQNVGLNTATPQTTLDVNGTIAGKSSLNLGDATNSGSVQFSHNSTNVITAIGASSNIEIRTNNIRAINIDSSQNVGLNTATPQKALDVVGDFKSGGSTDDYTQIDTSGVISHVGEGGHRLGMMEQSSTVGSVTCSVINTWYTISWGAGSTTVQTDDVNPNIFSYYIDFIDQKGYMLSWDLDYLDGDGDTYEIALFENSTIVPGSKSRINVNSPTDASLGKSNVFYRMASGTPRIYLKVRKITSISTGIFNFENWLMSGIEHMGLG